MSSPLTAGQRLPARLSTDAIAEVLASDTHPADHRIRWADSAQPGGHKGDAAIVAVAIVDSARGGATNAVVWVAVEAKVSG